MVGGRRITPSSEPAGRAASHAPAVSPRGFDDFEVRLGDIMRGERATLGKSLLDVQRDLKIKASYIAAIENCDVSSFETPGFIAGYVRSYARYLGLDPEATFQRFCAESGFVPQQGLVAPASRPRTSPSAPVPLRAAAPGPAPDPLSNPRAPFVPRGEGLLARIEPGALGSLAVLALLIGALGYGGWSVLREIQRVQVAPIEQAPGVMADLDPLARATAAPAAPAEGAGGELGLAVPQPDALDRIYRPAALDTPVLVARDGPIAAIDPRSFGALAGEGGDAAGPDGLFATGEAASGPGAAEVQVVEAGPPKVEILAVRPAWVRVQAADGTVLLEKILDAGERYEVPQTELPPRLRAGNSGAVYFVVNGEVYGPALPGAQVARNVVLSAESLTETYALADPERDADLRRMVTVAEAGPEAGR